MNKDQLINFEKEVKELWEQGKIIYPTHFSGGNEDQLIEIFKNIKPEDYVVSTHRSHYHFLLKKGSPEELKKIILEKGSMHIFNREMNFITTAIVAGGPAIAVGIALALKKKESNQHVWCFIGDGAEDEGHFYEAVRYVDGHNLSCTFIIEDNNRSVETPKKERYGNSEMIWPECVKRYNYQRTYPHVGTEKWVKFREGDVGGSSF